MKFQPPLLLRKVFPSLIWQKSSLEKKIYLTFDDGPIPEVTEFVLAQLKLYDAKATFFCIGDNIQKYPAVFNKILKAQHSIGNHTFNHLNGWKTPTENYVENVQACQKLISPYLLTDQKPLFRPPYGRISLKQYQILKKAYEIIMWDVLTRDYENEAVSKADICLKKSIQYTRNGSIVTFHDSLKAEKKLIYILPHFLDHFANLGYTFARL